MLKILLILPPVVLTIDFNSFGAVSYPHRQYSI